MVASGRNSRNASGTETIWQSIKKTSEDQLEVDRVGLNLEANRKAHFTSEYELEKLIVRRGQSFMVQVEFDGAYEPGKHEIILYLMYGTTPRISKGTLIKLGDKTNTKDNKSWGMSVKGGAGSDKIEIELMSSAKAMVGEYKIAVDCVTDGELTRFQVMDPLIVLFNAFCPEDPCYMENAEEREEYVMNDTGKVYVGSIKNVVARPWIFGQFDDTVLLSALYLLDSGDMLTDAAKGDVVQLTRAFTALANSSDGDGGVLQGNWSGDYAGGEAPTSWTGSVDVIETYWKKRPDMTKYGQCWVFSGILCSLYRTLGIPARSVTNFCSGHDHDGSNTIDIHFDHKGQSLSDYDDSTWNFHVWVDAWFKRADLRNSEYDGWQALDATPQEESGGTMQCGPAPLAAIKSGEVNIGYDTGFVFSEVNGDIVYWIVEEDGDMRIARVDTAGIGKLVATKAVGHDGMVDVKGEYKAEEGTAEERSAVSGAALKGARSELLEQYYNDKLDDDDVEFDVEHNEIKLGDSAHITLLAKNVSDNTHSINVTITAAACVYTGTTKNVIKVMENVMFSGEGSTSRCSMYLKPEDYVKKVGAENSLKISIKAEVVGTGQLFTETQQFDFARPCIVLTPNKTTIKKGNPIKMKIGLCNPLAIPLKNAKIRIEAAKNLKPVTINCGTVKPKHKVSATVSIPTKVGGKRQFVATFDSTELKNIQGECVVNIID